jgi:hypothetical protein
MESEYFKPLMRVARVYCFVVGYYLFPTGISKQILPWQEPTLFDICKISWLQCLDTVVISLLVLLPDVNIKYAQLHSMHGLLGNKVNNGRLLPLKGAANKDTSEPQHVLDK